MKEARACAEELCSIQGDNDFWENHGVVTRQEKYIPIITKHMEALLQHSGEKERDRIDADLIYQRKENIRLREVLKRVKVLASWGARREDINEKHLACLELREKEKQRSPTWSKI